eukprot:2512611-Pyramimonas_sp.AAC.1
MPAPSPSLPETLATWSRGARACSGCGGEAQSVTGMAGLRIASNMTAPPPSRSTSTAQWSRGARACSRCGGG